MQLSLISHRSQQLPRLPIFLFRFFLVDLLSVDVLAYQSEKCDDLALFFDVDEFVADLDETVQIIVAITCFSLYKFGCSDLVKHFFENLPNEVEQNRVAVTRMLLLNQMKFLNCEQFCLVN